MQRESRKERERKMHVQEILDATARLIAKKGISNISMDEIALEAGFGKGTLYNYFKSKQDLIWCLINHLFDEYKHMVEESLNSRQPFRAKLKTILEKSLEYFVKEAATAEIKDYIERKMILTQDSSDFQEVIQLSRNFHQIFFDIFQKAMQSGEIKKADPMRLSIMFFSTLISFARMGQTGLIKSSTRKDVEFLLDLICHKS
jgi:AcrR family transcriptional regulator